MADDNIEVMTSDDMFAAHGIETETKEEEKNDQPKEENATPKEDGDEKPKPKKNRAMKRIQKLAAEKRKLEEEVARLKGKTTKEPEPKEEGGDTTEPKEDDYKNYDEYLDAWEAWVAEPAEEKEDKQPKNEPEPEVETENPTVPKEVIEEIVDAGKEAFEDFEKVVSDPSLTLTQQMFELAAETDEPHKVLYYIGTHKNEAAEIAKIDDPLKLAIAIGKIEAKAAKAKQKKEVETTKAPEPIDPVKGSSTESKSLDDDDIDFQAFQKQLNDKMVHSRGGFL